jgi:hypothetical protein
VTVDNSSAEMHTTIYSISESPKNAGIIWVGTDDGNVQLTKDGGKMWTNLTKNVAGLPANSWVSWVEASRYDAATAYAAFDRHTFGDMTPWVYVTKDFGKTWTRIVGPEAGVRGYAHVIKEDPVKQGLLYVGTEFGLWISLDNGAKWARFEGGHLPAVAVRDIAFQGRENDLVLATHGRGIWIVDDLTPLRALSNDVMQKATAFLPTRPPQERMPAGGGWVEGDATFVGENPPNGVVITYYLRARHVFGPIKLEVLDAAGKLIDTVAPSKHRGINRVVWSMHVKPPHVPRAAQVAGNSTQGPRVVPGTYTIRLSRGSEVIDTKVTIGLDRRAQYSAADRKQQYDAVMRAHAMFGDMTKLVDKLDGTREAIVEREHALGKADPLAGKLGALATRLEDIKKKVVATTEGGAITGEERIREHLDYAYGALQSYEGRPAKYLLDRLDVLKRELGDVVKDFDSVVATDVKPLNDQLKAKKLEPISVIEKDRDGELDARDMRCVATMGHDCAQDVRAVATERE